jgi:preprotein translocase subunit YajC
MQLLDTAALFAMAQPAGAQPLLVQFLPFALILAIFYFIILLPMRRQRKRVQEFQSGLNVGDRVVTTSGIYGAVTKLHEKSVQLQIADKVRVEVSRVAIGGYQGKDPVVSESNQ